MQESDAGPAPSAAAPSPPATDPFQYLSQHISRRVAVTLLPHSIDDLRDGGCTVTGTLLSVDDLCNVLLGSWTSTDGIQSPQQPQQPRKKTRTEVQLGSGGEGEESMRLIRGAQIVSISLLL